MRLWLGLIAMACGCNAFAGAESELPGSGGSKASSTTTEATSGSGTASAGKGGGGAPTTTSGTTSGAGAGIEDCTNGIDDNGDGLVDCDDPQCSAYACVDTPPDGWSLPGAFYYGIAAGVPSCPMEDPKLATAGNGELMFEPDSCTTCTCGTRMGQSCDGVTVTTYPATGCVGTLANSNKTNLPRCQVEFSPKSLLATTNFVGGSCMPIGGSISNSPTPTWGKVGKVCAPDAVGKCSQASSVCAPKAGGEFGASVCISHPGDVMCPAAYSQKTTLYADNSDSRTCSTCNCVVPANDCTAQVTYYQGGNNDCGASSPPGTPIGSETGTCENATNIASVYLRAVSWPSANTQCTPQGGTAIGTVTGSNPTTVCCR